MNAFRHFVAPVAAICLGVGAIGCSSEPRAEQIPPNARMAIQGDRQLAYTAPRAGEIFVYDSDDDTLLYSGKVEKGQVVSVDPEEDKIMLDNQLVVEKDIHAGNRHRIYFIPDREDERIIEKSTTIRERSAAEPAAAERSAAEHSDADSNDAGTTIRREETKRVETDGDGVTVKKETTINAE